MKEIRYVKYYNDKPTMYMVNYNDNRSSDKWCSSLWYIQYFQGSKIMEMMYLAFILSIIITLIWGK